MRRIIMFLVALFFFGSAASALADTVAGMKASPEPAARDYTLEGEIVTIWEDSFLFNDSTGQVVVDVRPYTTSNLKLAGRDYVQLSGRMSGPVFKPMVIAKTTGEPVTFNGTNALPPLPQDVVTGNTQRYRFTPPEALNDAHAKPAATP